MMRNSRTRVGLVLAVMLGVQGCRGETAPDETPPEVKFESTQMQIKDAKFTVEIADTEARHERGLMYRDKMDADHGMLFVFKEAADYKFWMKNTKIPLDLVFLDASGKVVGICDLKPHDETPVGCNADSLYAIELNAGTAKKVGLKVGDKVALPEKVLKGDTRSDEK